MPNIVSWKNGKSCSESCNQMNNMSVKISLDVHANQVMLDHFP